MRAELLVALAPLPELEFKDSMTGRRCYNRCSRGVAQPGSAPALGAGGREFESRRPDQLIQSYVGDSLAAAKSPVVDFVAVGFLKIQLRDPALSQPHHQL